MMFDVRPSAPRRALFGWILLGSLAIAPALRAQEEPARFLLERITVEGAREAAGRIVEAETLLREGETYSEEELAQAVARVHRLPFVLDTDFSLRKGSERGAYELLIQVEEARRFFFDHSLRGSYLAQPLDLDDTITNDERDLSGSLPGVIGFRQFIGRSGVVFAALDNSDGLQLGFTRYDLFGRGIVASVGYSGLAQGLCCSSEVLAYGLDPTFVSWSWDVVNTLSLELGVPLDASDALRFAWSRRDGEASSRNELFGLFRFGEPFVDAPIEGSDLTLDRAEVKWVRDTSDDPLVPTRGFTLAAGLEWSAFETGPLVERQVGERGFYDVAVPLPPQESEQVAAVVSAVRHWSLTPRQTVSGLGRVSVGQASLRNLPIRGGVVAEQDLDVFGGSLGLRHAVRLWQARGDRGFGDLYLESTAELGVESTSPDIQPGRAPNPLQRFEVSTGLVFRNVWGRLRLVVSYLDVGEVL